ncbi:MAG: hypothetical protein ABEJ42_06880 [Halobacteriaceae archaeon]
MSRIAGRREGGPGVGRLALLLVLVGALVVAPGCSSITDGGGDGGGAGPSNDPALDVVPSGVDAVFYADVNGAVADQQLRTVANALYGLSDSGPQSVDEAITRMEANTSLTVEDLEAVTAYGTTNASSVEEGYGAMVVSADWSLQTVVKEIENSSDITMEATTFQGKSFWRPGTGESGQAVSEGSYVGKLSETRFVVGSETAVKDALRVATGNAEAFSGTVRTAFENTRADSYVRYAATVPQGRVDPGEQIGQNAAVFDKVTLVSGSQYVAGGEIGLNTTMTFESASAASDAASVIDGSVSVFRGMYASSNSTKALVSEENLTIRTDGTDLTVTVTNTPSTITTAFEQLYQLFASFGQQGGASTRAPPAAALASA